MYFTYYFLFILGHTIVWMLIQYYLFNQQASYFSTLHGAYIFLSISLFISFFLTKNPMTQSYLSFNSLTYFQFIKKINFLSLLPLRQCALKFIKTYNCYCILLISWKTTHQRTLLTSILFNILKYLFFIDVEDIRSQYPYQYTSQTQCHLDYLCDLNCVICRNVFEPKLYLIYIKI